MTSGHTAKSELDWGSTQGGLGCICHESWGQGCEIKGFKCLVSEQLSQDVFQPSPSDLRTQLTGAARPRAQS